MQYLILKNAEFSLKRPIYCVRKFFGFANNLEKSNERLLLDSIFRYDKNAYRGGYIFALQIKLYILPEIQRKQIALDLPIFAI